MFSIKLHNALKNLAFIFTVVFGLIIMSGVEASAQGKGKAVRSGRNDRVVKNNPVNDEWSDRRWWNQDEVNRKRRERDNDRYNDRYNGRDRQGNQSLRFAYQQGYNAGFREGMRDARNRDRSDHNGNRNGWGNSKAWQNAYDNGFDRGYLDGYDRYRSQRKSGYLWPN